MKTYLPFISLLMLLIACQPDAAESDFGTDPPYSVEIPVGKDTTIVSPEGLRVRIFPKSFKTDKSHITLHIWTYLEPYEMIQAGLHTMSADGEILESAGMFRIESPDEVEINPEVGLEVGVPTDVLVPDMKLFSRDEEGDWVLEDDLIETPELLEIVEGKRLFEANCTSCHYVDKVLIGPALGNISEYRDTAYLRAFTRNSAQLIMDGDSLAICIWEQYNRQVMTAFPDFSVAQLDAIYAYIESETRRLGLESEEPSYAGSCGRQGDTLLIYDKEGRIIDKKFIGEIEYGPLKTEYVVNIGKLAWYNIRLVLV